jgi:hypothetical protein
MVVWWSFLPKIYAGSPDDGISIAYFLASFKKFEVSLFMPSIQYKGLLKNFACLWYLNLHLQKDYETSNITSLCTYSF